MQLLPVSATNRLPLGLIQMPWGQRNLAAVPTPSAKPSAGEPANVVTATFDSESKSPKKVVCVLGKYPSATARAWRVIGLVNRIAPLKTGELVVGGVPSTV